MTLYSNLNLFFIKLFTMLVPRWLYPPFTLFWGGLFYLLLGEKRRAVAANLRVVTGRDDVERLVFSTFRTFAHNWSDVMLMMRLKGERLQRLIGRRGNPAPSGFDQTDRISATGLPFQNSVKLSSVVKVRVRMRSMYSTPCR